MDELNSWAIAVKNFYDRFYNIDTYHATELFNRNYELKSFLLEKLHTKDERNAKNKARSIVTSYYAELAEQLQSIPEEKHKVIIDSKNPGVNARNIYCNEKPHRPKRLTIFELAFALGLNASDCNKMLRMAGLYDIHLGGDPQESIIYFCLEKKLSHLDAIRMYEQYLKNEPMITPPEDYQKTTSQRSVFIAEEFLNAIKIGCLDASKAEFEKKLYFYAASYSYFSGRIRKYFLNLLDIYEKDTDLFCDDFCRLFPRRDIGIKRELEKIQDEESHPTRECVCLALCLDYYREYTKHQNRQSLEDFINAWLVSFGMAELNDAQLFDALLIELSHYRIGKRIANAVQYAEGPWFRFPCAQKDPIGQAGEIIKCYCSGPYDMIEPITYAKLIDKNSFLQDLFLKTPGDKRK